MPTRSLFEHEKPKFPNVFKMELTPPAPVINPDVPFSMSVKNMTEDIQAVEIEVESYLFEIMDARAKVWPYSQIYRKVEPGGTLSFQIGVTKETPEESLKQERDIVMRMDKPEGMLKIYHTAAEDMVDTDTWWGFEEELIDYIILPGRRIVDLSESRTQKHGHVEMELICEKETKLIKKRRNRFKKKMSKSCSIM